MRLLFVIPEYLPQEGGGIITFYRHLLPELARQGHEVHALVGSGVSLGLAGFQRDGVVVEYLAEQEFRASLARFRAFDAVPSVQKGLAAAWAMWEKAGRGDAFNLVETSDWSLLFVPWVLEPGPPVVVRLHGSMRDPDEGEETAGLLKRLVESAGLARASELQAYSRSNAGFWKDVTGRDVTAIPPAWPLPAEPPGDDAEPSPAAVVVARAQRWKGPDVHCRALRRLGPSAPDVTWVGRETRDAVSGEGYGSSLARDYPDMWGRKVKAVGSRSRAETEALQRRAAFAIVPSQWDTFNFTCVEAMGMARPVVCSTGAGASEHVEEGVSGFTVPPDDEERLAAALDRVSALSPVARREMGRAGRERIRTALAVDVVAARRVERYRAVAASGTAEARKAPWSLRPFARDAGVPPFAFPDQLPVRELLKHSARSAQEEGHRVRVR